MEVKKQLFVIQTLVSLTSESSLFVHMVMLSLSLPDLDNLSLVLVVLSAILLLLFDSGIFDVPATVELSQLFHEETGFA